jgi:cation transport protein ChaC
VTVETTNGKLRAIAFVINRQGGRYVGGLSLDEIADALAVAAGPVGTMADYLYSTVSHLEDLGLHDRQLWRLQEMVAERIEAAVIEKPDSTHHKIAPNDAAESFTSGQG